MSTASHLRGHPIVYADGVWRYQDTGEPTTGTSRPCGHCGLPDTPEGHDARLDSLPGVMNACCGHGETPEAYIQYPDGRRIAGVEAVREFVRSRQPRLTRRHIDAISRVLPTRGAESHAGRGGMSETKREL